MIKDPGGTDISNQGGIKEVFRHHFQLVYQSSNPSALDIDKGTQGVTRRVNSAMNISLTEPFTKEEVEMTLNQMAHPESPGPSGFNPSFY